VLRALRVGKEFRLYITTRREVVGAMLAQENDSKDHVVAYLSRCLLDTETRYTYVEKLCLSLYYTCAKFHHYILSGTCMVVCQHDIIKHMLNKPILGGRLGKWAYSLV
jgi:hypothetical protein